MCQSRVRPKVSEAELCPFRRSLRTSCHIPKRVNVCLGIGLSTGVTSLKRLSMLSYRELKPFDCPSYYKLCAISKATGILAARRKSLKRGNATKSPYAAGSHLVAHYGFKIQNGSLRIPIGRRRYFDIPLVEHTLSVLSEALVRVRSFTLTAETVGLCISKEVKQIECDATAGVDRNLRALTYGNERKVVHYDLSKTVVTAQTTRSILASFKRNDARIRQKIAFKYGRRMRNRKAQPLHKATKQIVEQAFENKEALVLEDIRGIRRLYRRGNWQGRRYRATMNTWSFSEVQRQLEYKARWIGLPVIRLSRRETMGTSSTCPKCGERLQSDKNHGRELWCRICKSWMDRDMVAVVNLSRRGRLRFDRSKGGTVEAVMRNPTPTVIPGVDALEVSLSSDKLTEPQECF